METIVPIGYNGPRMSYIVVHAPDVEGRCNLDDVTRGRVDILAVQLETVALALTHHLWRLVHVVSTSDIIANDTAHYLRSIYQSGASIIRAANRPGMVIAADFPLLSTDYDKLGLKGAELTILVADAMRLPAISQSLTGTDVLSGLTEFAFRTIVDGKCQSVALTVVSKTA